MIAMSHASEDALSMRGERDGRGTRCAPATPNFNFMTGPFEKLNFERTAQ